MDTVETADQDATIIESYKKSARATYNGCRRCQPLVAIWAEMGLVLVDEFREGNIPAAMAPLDGAQAAFAARASEQSAGIDWLCD